VHWCTVTSARYLVAIADWHCGQVISASSGMTSTVLRIVGSLSRNTDMPHLRFGVRVEAWPGILLA